LECCLDISFNRSTPTEAHVRTLKIFASLVIAASFCGAETLKEPDRIGKIADSQGIVAVRPATHERWTLAGEDVLLEQGDLVRTDVRGANAARIQLAGASGLILGPGTLVELVGPADVRLLGGELEVQASGKAPLKITGPDRKTLSVDGKRLLRLEKSTVVPLAREPKWLQGFKGTIAKESLGSLVAKVDGRDVPLTVGYHKVTVDIRDQIARTVIEESFVNHTAGQLEGVFYFPLPADASISGFGMWINETLVEADVVEKQRAREIYETILRERRDPGLLEWTGGNIFKARVFPIFAHSEKRIKITYTQVLPLKAASYRYSYGLESELLKQNPLRELSIQVKIHSALPLSRVQSPTHAATRIRNTRNSAQVDFTAQEYTPERDFEVVMDLDPQYDDVVLIPHQRGDDGYFLLLVHPPGDGGGWKRALLPDSQPLELLILADTSGSMDATARQRQEAFLAALISSLGKNDTIKVAACDVGCTWMDEKPAAGGEAALARVREFLSARHSLGWSDLEKAFAQAIAKAGPQTHVIYLGDGIVTAGDGDPVGFARKLKQMYTGKGTFHAVATSTSYEQVVLSAIATLGGGSVRRIQADGAAQDAGSPQAVAAELLGEMAQTPVRDLKIEFDGLQTARVYPNPLPNLARGAQQIILGRYLPAGRAVDARVTVSGTQGGKPVKFETKVSVADAGQGNSFIPRLWARMHLDALLEQGASTSIQEEIVALSEEYQIMTPYTSFLVLESDADRERFKVKRRFRMRDGEKFFAQGGDQASYDLVQQQMQRAGNWRIGIRRRVLAELAEMGRGTVLWINGGPEQSGKWGEMDEERAGGSGFSGRGGMRLGLSPRGNMAYAKLRSHSEWQLGLRNDERFDAGMRTSSDYLPASSAPLDQAASEDEPRYYMSDDIVEDTKSELAEDLFAGNRIRAEAGELFDAEQDYDSYDFSNFPASISRGRISSGKKDRNGLAFNAKPGWYSSNNLKQIRFADSIQDAYGRRSFEVSNEIRGLESGFSQLNLLIPNLAPPPIAPISPPSLERWPAEARALAESLLRTGSLSALRGGLLLTRRSETFDVRRNVTSEVNQELDLVSPKAWLTHTWGDTSQSLIQWCDPNRRGILSLAFELGRTRASVPLELAKPPLPLADYSLSSLEETYRGYVPAIEKQADDRVLLKLHHKSSSPTYEIRAVIDTRRHVLLSMEHSNEGKLTSSTTYDDFVEVAGTWWATRMESHNGKRQRTALIKSSVKELSAADFNKRLENALRPRQRALMFEEPLPSLRDAKQALAAGKAKLEHQLVLLLHFAGSQQWKRVDEHLQSLEKLAGEKPGAAWLRNAVLLASRRHEILRQRILAEAARLAKQPPPTNGEGDVLYLANHLLAQYAYQFEPSERLAIVNILRPAYQKAPAHVLAIKQWQQQRLNFLQQSNQQAEALELMREIADAYSFDSNLQVQYAQNLANQGEHEAAYRRLTKALESGFAWEPHEADSLRSAYAQLLEGQGRMDDLVTYLAKWIALEPASNDPYRRYLAALLRTNQIDKAQALMEQWMQPAREGKQLASPASERLSAAVQQALGHGHGMYHERIDERWLKPLADVVRLLIRQKSYNYLAGQIMEHSQFRVSDEGKQLRREVLAILQNESLTLPPQQLGIIVNWVLSGDPIVETPVLEKLVRTLEERWSAEKDPGLKQQLAQPVLAILNRISSDRVLAFLERQLAEASKQYRPSCAQQLFGKLLELPWTQAHEDRAFTLLDELGAGQPEPDRLVAQVIALHQLIDRMIATRVAQQVAALEHPEKLSRSELRAKYEAIGKAAHTALADRLAKERAAHSQQLVPWFTVERMYLDARLNRNLQGMAAEAWESLGSKPKPTADAELDWPALVLETRYLATLLNLAAREKADPKLVRRLLEYLDRGNKAEPDSPIWKVYKYQLLVALDRPQELERTLRTWIQLADADNTWRVSLGYLLAEQGRLAEAIALFEAVEAADELAPPEYRALADWYMAKNRKERHQRALIAAYLAEGEQMLQQRLYAHMRPWQRYGSGDMPTQLDPEILNILTALFQKSSNPQNSVWQLKQLYEYSRDFRLLECLADSVVGHSAMQIYPFLDHLQQVLSEIRDEATVDALLERVKVVRAREKTDVDRRAVDLLTFLVERRACELKNQPAPHAAVAVQALRKSAKGKWEPTERRLLADLLANLGRIATPELSREQLNLLRTLHADEKPGSYDRLHIADRWAAVLWQNSRAPEAIDLLESALNELRQASGGVLPLTAHTALDNLIDFFESQQHFARGEQTLLAAQKRSINDQQTAFIRERLYQLYVSAVAYDGTVSLGSGLQLYQGAQSQIIKELPTADPNHGYRLVNHLCSLYRAAHNKKLAGVGQDLAKFAQEDLPTWLIRQSQNHQSSVSLVAEAMQNIIGPKAALAFLIERIEQEPAYLRYTNQDSWSQHSYQLARWRTAVPDLGELDARLLKIVTNELRLDLESGRSRNQNIYRRHNDMFWKEKIDDFAAVAESVLEKHRNSSSTISYVAEYLFYGLERKTRAIDVLAEAHRRKVLDEQGQTRLVQYLHETNRYAESIPILLPLVELRSQHLSHRVMLMHAYFRTGQNPQLIKLLDDTDKHFHDKKLWNEGTLAQLAISTLANDLFERSVAYYNELIPLHQRSQPNQGIGNGTLSSYYRHLAEAYSGLNRTPEAVEAASAAIVSWGPQLKNRRDAIAGLKSALSRAPDLDAYVKLLDKQVEESGLENPIVRKALGQVYLTRKDLVKAADQLRRAVEVQPSDAETYQDLVSALDQLGKPEEAIAQLHRALELSRRNLELAKDLARRYAAVGQADEAERAYTTIVEMLPTEAESHQMLAEIRQQQDRWPDAVNHWEQVARLRALEPTGYLGLTSALIRSKNLEQAAKTLQKLSKKDWPARFGDVQNRTRDLERQLEAARGS